MDSLLSCLIVFGGAGIGGSLRYGVNTLVLRVLGPDYPVGTLIINVTGCLVMGGCGPARPTR
jgi:CrcB protein|nr:MULTISPECIES: CrcB family protein [unclassified Devosia]